MSHDHSHVAGGTTSRRLTIALCLTASYMVAEVVGGLMTGSLALLSDAAHMLTDVAALVIALCAIKIGARSADLKRTFGYRRLEILAAAVNAVALFVVAIYILYEAYQRFLSPPPIASTGMLVIAAFGLVVNIISMRVLTGDHESINMRAAYLELFSDMLGSVGVIVAALVIKFTGWQQVDPILAVLIGLWVLPRTWRLLLESVNILLEGVPAGMKIDALLADLCALPSVTDVHDLHVWSVTSGQNSLTAHLTVDALPTDDALLAAARDVAKRHKIEHTSFQVETTDCGMAAMHQGRSQNQEHDHGNHHG